MTRQVDIGAVIAEWGRKIENTKDTKEKQIQTKRFAASPDVPAWRGESRRNAMRFLRFAHA